MKTVHGQVIASTSLDLHGEQLTETQLKLLFENMHPESILNQDHDMSKPVVGRMYNKRLSRLESGTLAILVDIDVLDEEAYAAKGGISLSYKRNHYSINPNREAEIEVLYNPRVFSYEEIESLMKLSNSELQIDAVEMVQKAFDAIVLMVLAFAGMSIANGFLKKAGSDIYDTLKSRLKKISQLKKEKLNQETIFQMQIQININQTQTLVLIQFSAEQFNVIDGGRLSTDALLDRIYSAIGVNKAQRVVVIISESDPFWKIVSYVNSEGITITF
ncbi:MAG: hypothetical protein JRN15_08370 [Nitrososphaerota archaeon]|nr:hypothetical protein [Nitrososphaerota archaeon]